MPRSETAPAHAPAVAPMLHPAHFLALGFSTAHAHLAIWRAVFDASRAAIRRQQDLAIEALSLPMVETAGRESADDQAGGRVQAFDPFLAAARSFEQWSDAALAAQRNTLSAVWRDEPRH